jgi:hypothetical protein
MSMKEEDGFNFVRFDVVGVRIKSSRGRRAAECEIPVET